jgi:alpha 1,3-glucosidase
MAVGKTVHVSAPLEKIPVFIRGGRIIPRKMRLRRSASLMFHDPLTFTVAPDINGDATGNIYMDDEKTLAHEIKSTGGRDNFVMRTLSYNTSPDGTTALLRCVASDPSVNTAFAPLNTVERIELLGQNKKPTSVLLNMDGEEVALNFVYDIDTKTVRVKNPKALVAADWTISLVF